MGARSPCCQKPPQGQEGPRSGSMWIAAVKHGTSMAWSNSMAGFDLSLSRSVIASRDCDGTKMVHGFSMEIFQKLLAPDNSPSNFYISYGM
ncbi:unnamed protein product [Urochloa humidicola]